MVPGTVSYVIVILFFASTLANNDDSAYVDLSPENDTVSRLESPRKTDINDSAITDEEKTPRDKRALGVILQGLVEALGYTVSPISYASLPNPNTTSPAPPQKPNTTAGSAPGQMTTMAPRQRETLRLTGVLNFGNNSDLLGHLQQYERIFHGNATTTAAPAPGRPAPPPARPPPPPPPPGPASGKPALLTPFFVPIPLPLAADLVPLPPSAPRRAKVKELTYAKQENNESFGRESQEISDEKDVRRDPPGRESDRDTYIDEPRWMKKQREKQEDERKKYREENDRESDSSEENEEIEQKNKYREQEIADREREDAGRLKQQQIEEEEESAEEDDKKGGYRDDEEEDEDSREGEKYTKKSEDTKDDRENASGERDGDDESSEEERPVKSKTDAEDTTSRSDYDKFDEPFGYLPRKIPSIPKQFGNRLPIRVFDEPFSTRGELRNSYGESLEQGGKIDESVADYFQRYKNPETGLFDSRKIQTLQGPKEKDHWWSGDQTSVPGLDSDALERIRQEYAPPANKRYEEYNSKRKDDEAGQQKSRKDDPEERIYDEGVESTEVKSRSVEGRSGTTASKNTIQYPRVPANTRHEEYESKSEDGEVEEQRIRKKDPEEKGYDERVESTEAKDRPVKGRTRARIFKNTIQHPRVPANARHEEYESKSEDGEVEEQRIRKKDPEEKGYDERVESTESKDRPAKGRTRARIFKNTIQHPRVPANTRHEEYESKSEDGEVEEQRIRKKDPEEKGYDERVESTEAKDRPVKGRTRARIFKNTIQHPRVPASTSYEDTKRDDSEVGEQRSRKEDPEEKEYDERLESTEAKSRSVEGREGTITSKSEIQHPTVPANDWYEQFNSERKIGEMGEHKSRKNHPEREEPDERDESTEPKYKPVNGRGGAIYKNTIQHPRAPANTRYEEYDSRSGDAEVGEQRSRNKDSEEKEYERVESPEAQSRSVEGREGRITSTKTIQHSRVPANTRYEEYDSEGKDAEVGEQRSRKVDPEEEKYDERVESTEPKYRPVKQRGKVRVFKNTIQPPRAPANTKYEQYDPTSDDGEVQEQRSRMKSSEEKDYSESVESTEGKSRSVEGREEPTRSKNTIQHSKVPVKTRYEEYNSEGEDGEVGEERSRTKDTEEEYDESVVSTEPKYRPMQGRGRARMFKNTVQHPRARANSRYEEYDLPREDERVVEPRGRKEDTEEKEYDDRAETTDSKYRPMNSRGRARTFQSYEGEDERSGSASEDGRTKVREKEATSRDEDADEIIAEPTVTTYTHVNALEESGKSNYEDGSKESEEVSPYEPSSERINLSDYDSAEESTGLSKFQLLDPKNPLVFKGFDFIKYSPYFRPIQVSYEPVKLQRTAARILSSFGDFASDDKSRSSEQFSDKNLGSPQRLVTATVRGDEYITHNPYLKPIQVAYEPEKLQRTADRILSYHNAVGLDKSPQEDKHEMIHNEEKTKEEKAEEKEEDRSAHNSKESDGPSKSYEEEDGRSADNASDDDEPSQNYEERENHSVDKSNEDEGTSRNYEEREDRSSVNREIENDAKPGVGLPERLTGKKLHEGESKELRAWPAPFDHTFDSTERAKVARLPNSEVSTKIRDEDVEPTYQTPAFLEFQSTIPNEKYPANADVTPTYETRSSAELRTSGPNEHYPLDSDVSPTDESPSTEKSSSIKATVSRSNSKTRRRPQSDPKKNSGPNDDLEKGRKSPRVTKDEAQDRSTIQSSRSKHREESENPKSRYNNPTIRLQIFEPSEAKDFSEEGSRSEQQHDVGVGEILRLPGHQRKFEDPQSAHDFFGFGRDDYVLKQDANNAQKYGEHAQRATTNSGSNQKELKGLLVITHEPDQQDEVVLTKFTEEPETETERVKVNEYRNKVATLKVSERRQSTPHGPVRHVGFTKSL